jgi:hypothetical protein
MGRTRYQEGSLRLENRKRGKVWRLRFRITRADGHRVEHAIVIGTQKELPTRTAAGEFVKSLYLPINNPTLNNNVRPVTFSDIAGHYIQEELTEDQNQASGSARKGVFRISRKPMKLLHRKRDFQGGPHG